jgi:hypothetical protein
MRTMHSFFLTSFITATALSTFLTTAGNAPAVEPPATSVHHDGQNVLIIGHSLTHCLRGLESLAPMVGHPGHKQMLYTFLGAGIAYHYQTETNQWTPVSWRKLYFAPDKTWDALIMSARDAHWKGPQEISSDEEYAPKFAAEAFKTNPKCQIFIYGNWPSVEFLDNPPFGNTEAHIERVGDAVDKAFPNAPKTRLMPCSLLMRELGHMAERGELPGVTSRFGLYSDGGHQNRVSSYAFNVLVMAMLYNESPLAYPSDIHPVDLRGEPVRGDVFKDIQVAEETATVMKRVVWDILQTYPRAGMKPMLVIANRRLEPVIAGQPCKAELKALHAAGPCAWSIVKGTLPQGLSLSRDGVFSGQSAAVGDYPLTIQLSDGKSRSERPLIVQVNQDKPPVIPDQALESVSLDRHVLHPLKVDGGVGHITWSVGGGTLPHGLRLSPDGMLVGSPGEEGEFVFKIKAEDTFPGGPRSTEKSFTWKIGPPAPGTLLVKSITVTGKPDDKTVVIDGKLDKPFWKLDQAIDKKVQGTPTKKASFGAVWTHLPRNPARKEFPDGRELVLAFKVLDGPKGKTPKDGIHIFMDGNHNRSVIYSGDDTHFFVPRNHKGGWAQSLRGKVNWFTNARVQEIEGGYTMEISLGGGNYFSGEGNWLKFGAKGVYGFDVAVDEGDDKEISQQVWRGDANDAEDTSHFGTLVLMEAPAVAAQSQP